MKNQKMARLFTFPLAGVLFVAAGWAQNTATATGAAAIVGSFGLEVAFDGSSNAATVTSNHPDSETTYRASFWVEKAPSFFADNCSTTCSTRHVAFLIRGANPDGPSPPNVTVGRLIVRRLAFDGAQGARYSLVYAVRNNFGGFVQVGSTLLTGTTVKKHITLEWQAGSPADANDGVARMYSSLDGSLGNMVGERTTVANGDMAIDFVQLGAASALGDQPSDAATTGSLYYDEFQSFRTLATP